MRLSILIVNWRSKDYLAKALESISMVCADLNPEVVVVDGGSFDGCGEMLLARYPDVKFVQSEQNIGFGRCNNLGFNEVTGDALLLLNPDTELRPSSVQKMLESLRTLDCPGIIGPKLLNSDGSLQTSCVRALPTPLNQALDSEWLRRLLPRSRLWGNWEAFQSTKPVAVEGLSGACMLLWTETFRKVGGFSPEFFMYGEDYDLCFKVIALGLTNYYVPDAEVVHHGGQSSGQQIKKFSTVLMRESDYFVVKKWRGFKAAALYRCFMAFSAAVRIIAIAVSSLAPRRGLNLRQRVLKWWFVFRWAMGLESWAKVKTLPR